MAKQQNDMIKSFTDIVFDHDGSMISKTLYSRVNDTSTKLSQNQVGATKQSLLIRKVKRKHRLPYNLRPDQKQLVYKQDFTSKVAKSRAFKELTTKACMHRSKKQKGCPKAKSVLMLCEESLETAGFAFARSTINRYPTHACIGESPKKPGNPGLLSHST